MVSLLVVSGPPIWHILRANLCPIGSRIHIRSSLGTAVCAQTALKSENHRRFLIVNLSRSFGFYAVQQGVEVAREGVNGVMNRAE